MLTASLSIFLLAKPDPTADERVSPPPSDFFHEQAIIVPALDRYSSLRKSMENQTDNEILDIEESIALIIDHTL